MKTQQNESKKNLKTLTPCIHKIKKTKKKKLRKKIKRSERKNISTDATNHLVVNVENDHDAITKE